MLALPIIVCQFPRPSGRKPTAMSRQFKKAALAILFAAAGLTAHAQAQTTFAARRLSVAGNTDLDATAINDHDDIVATLFDTANNTQSGVILHHGTVTTLPNPYGSSGPAIPQAINSRGDVLGYTYEGYEPIMFLWQAGKYNGSASQIALVIEQQAGPQPLPIGLNAADAVFYTIITGQQNPTDPIYGKLAHLRSMPYIERNQTAHSINRAGMIAGNAFYQSQSEVFVGKGKNFTTLLPSGAQSAEGGFVNDMEQVAGIYTDSLNVQHGFVWHSGAYTRFDLPETAQPYTANVTGINDSGRVVGVYTSSSTGMVRAFLYNGTVASAFGGYNSQDVVSVAINNNGTMLVADQIGSSSIDVASYRVTCTGSGC